MLVTAFAPMAFFLSAVYSESLYLALSVGALLCGAPAVAGRSSACSARSPAATRSAGIVLLLPALMLYLYGPREDRPPDFPRARGGLTAPRYRLRPDVAVARAGAGRARRCTCSTSALAGGDALAPFHAQDVWGRHFAGPYLGVWDGLQAAFEGARQLLSFQQRHVYFPIAGGSAFVARRAQPAAARFPARGDRRRSIGVAAHGCRSPTART